jgi:hypothetical protein
MLYGDRRCKKFTVCNMWVIDSLLIVLNQSGVNNFFMSKINKNRTLTSFARSDVPKDLLLGPDLNKLCSYATMDWKISSPSSTSAIH